MRSAAWNPDGTMLATGGDSGTLIWDPATGEQLRELATAGNWTPSVVWSPDGTTLAGCQLGMLRLWDVASGRLMGTLIPLS